MLGQMGHRRTGRSLISPSMPAYNSTKPFNIALLPQYKLNYSILSPRLQANQEPRAAPLAQEAVHKRSARLVSWHAAQSRTAPCATGDVEYDLRKTLEGDGYAKQERSFRLATPAWSSCALRCLRRKVWPHSLLQLPHGPLFENVRRAFQAPPAGRQPLAMGISTYLTVAARMAH
jgi:hypothetical protein